MDALGPLRARAAQLAATAAREKAGALHTYETSARPALKEQAASLKESLVILAREEAALQERVAGLASQAVAGADPSVHTGFNVIRARTGADGQSLSLEELRVERQQLIDTLDVLGRQVEAAKREITRQHGGRPEDQEVWETQLVALQDTKRVYRDEINLIEVELLGREHSERIAAERAAAEASGAAQLQRLQEQLLQTRIKYNRAKYQYYHPAVKGYNINFGGGGIFGACQNIDIAEINGHVTIRGEAGAVGPDGAVIRPARLLVQFEAAGAHRQQSNGGKPPVSRKPSHMSASSSLRSSGNFGEASASAGLDSQSSFSRAPPSPLRRVPSAGGTADSSHLTPRSASSGGGRLTAQAAAQQLQRKSATPAQQGPGSGGREEPQPARVNALRSGSSRQQQSNPGSTAPSLDSAGSDQLLEQAASAVAGAGQRQAAPPPAAARSQLGGAQPPPLPPFHQQQASPSKEQQKGKNAALRFLSRLGSKKDKYQSKDRSGGLQPAASEDVEGAGGDKQKLRTLAGKLLNRKSSKMAGAGRFSTGSLDRLAFGGHQLSRDAERRSQSKSGGLAGECIDEEASVRSDSNAGDDMSDMGAGENGASSENLGAEVHYEGDGSLASDDDSDDEEEGDSLTQDVLQHAYLQQQQQLPPSDMLHGSGSMGSMPLDPAARSTSSRGGGGSSSWLRGRTGSASGLGDGGGLEEGSSVFSLGDMGVDATDGLPVGVTKQGVFVTGRLNDFDLKGESGTKCPNLTIGQADVTADVFVRFVFQYDKKGGGWRQAEKPLFDVQHLTYKLKGNNVPMPSTLVKHLLRVFIPEIIQRRLLPLFPKEFGEYMLAAQRGFEATADVAVVGPSLKVLDADLAFEVRGPARSSKEARKQQQKYAAAKEARSLLGLSLPQAQVLAELFGGRSALLDPPRPATIKQLIAFQAHWDRHPHLYDQICQVWNTAYQVVAQRQRGVGDFSFRAFMKGPVARVRRKPARARVIMRHLDVGLNADGLVNMIHDYTQRTLEELFIKGPIANTRDNPEYQQESLEEQQEVLHAWHSWVLRELGLFKSKFRGAAATLLGAGDVRSFSLGVENAFYEGPLRLRLPVAMQLDRDGAFSFELPLPSPEGSLGVFMDGFKGLVIPSHLRPPAQAINWIPLTGDPNVDAAMQKQVWAALEAIREVLLDLNDRIAEQGLEAEDADPAKTLSCPRTKVGDRLGRFIVNRLKVRVRLDERRIGEILAGIDSASMGPAFVSTAGRLLGHLGDVMTLGFTPLAPPDPKAAEGAEPPSQYLLQFESSDISRLRADVQSLGFASLVSPGGMVRLVHAVVKNFLLAFKGMSEEGLAPLEERFRTWYANMTREGLDISMCVDAKAALTEGAEGGGQCLLRLSGTADDTALRETSPLFLVNDLDLVTLGKAMRGDPPAPTAASAAAAQQRHGGSAAAGQR